MKKIYPLLKKIAKRTHKNILFFIVLIIFGMVRLGLCHSDLERVLTIVSMIVILTLYFTLFAIPAYCDAQMELIGCSFLYEGSKYKIEYYLYCKDEEIFGVVNSETNKVHQWDKRKLYKALNDERECEQ